MVGDALTSIRSTHVALPHTVEGRIVIGAGGALAFAAIGAANGATPLVLAQLALAGTVLAVAAASDLVERRIPNRLVLPATAAGAGLALAAGINAPTFAAALAIVAALTGIALVRPDALGMGDVKLAALIAVALGDVAPAALSFGLLFAAVASATLVCLRGRRVLKSAIPIAPFMCLGSLAALFW